MILKKVLLVVVVAGPLFGVAPTKGARALSLINPSPIAVETMTAQVRWHRPHWRHRHWRHVADGDVATPWRG
jgi:hypothetical protein